MFGPAENLLAEAPCLLDPIVAADPSLLSFLDDGSAAPSYTEKDAPILNLRATVSIRVYNLNDVKVREERFLVAQEIKRQVQRGEKYLSEALAGNGAAYDHFQEVYRIVLNLIGPSSEFSAAARTILSGFRDKDWVIRALNTA